MQNNIIESFKFYLIKYSYLYRIHSNCTCMLTDEEIETGYKLLVRSLTASNKKQNIIGSFKVIIYVGHCSFVATVKRICWQL